MPSTTNFGWTTPADTDLVKDGASAIRTLGNGIDTTLVDLKGGTTGQVLSKNSNTDMDFTWVAQDDSNAIQNAIVDAKGDLITATAADTPSRIAVGTDGQVLTADSTQSTGLKWATPSTGLTWTLRVQGAGNKFADIAYNGSNLYVAVGNAGRLLTSADGKTWTSRTSGFGANHINGIAFGAGIFVAVGNNGTITTSTDGITWTSRTANMGTNGIYQVTYANSLFVAVGAGGGSTNTGGITYSSDGITWTRKSQTITVGTQYNDVGWNGTNWIVVATNSTNNYLYASTPSGTWTAGADGSAQELTGYWWDGTRNIVSTSTKFKYSTSATLGTTTQYDVVYAWQLGVRTSMTSKLYNGVMYSMSAQYIYSFTPTTNGTTSHNGDITINPVCGLNGPDIANLGGSGAVYWVGATGRIAGNGDGSLWTSF